MRSFKLRNSVVVLMADNELDRKAIGDLMFETKFVGNQMSYINETFMFESKSHINELINYLEEKGCNVTEEIRF